MRVPVVLAMLVTAATLSAQTRPESGPETRRGIEAIKPLMAAIRAGDTDVESVRGVVTELLASERAIAAPWWLQLTQEAQPDAKRLPAERETLAKLRRAAERPESFAEERKVALRLIRQTESLVAAKDFAGARHAAKASKAFLGLIPDAHLGRLLDAAEKKIPAPGGDQPAMNKTETAWPPGLEVEAAAAWRALIDQGLAAYANAGCRPGRYVLARAIRNAAALVAQKEVVAELARLRGLTRLVEPRSGLLLFVRTLGTAKFFRDGEPLAVTAKDAPFEADKHDPIDIPALPGDLVTIAFSQPYASDEISRSYVIAFNGRFESRDLGAKDLFCELSDNPGQAGAPLLPVPIARKKPNPPLSLFGQSKEQDEALKASNTYFELPKTNRRTLDVPCFGDMIAFLQEFDTRKLAPILIGTETDHFALVIKVPE